jgi:hypothetical protein
LETLKIDLNAKQKLLLEMIPTTVSFSSLFQLYNKNQRLNDWIRIKEEIYEKEGFCCWLCGKPGEDLILQEFWEYDDTKHIMTLVSVHHLCDYCHKLKHLNLWLFTDYGQEQLRKLAIEKEDLIEHYCSVNDCSKEQFDKNWKNALCLWKERSTFQWKLDFGIYKP